MAEKRTERRRLAENVAGKAAAALLLGLDVREVSLERGVVLADGTQIPPDDVSNTKRCELCGSLFSRPDGRAFGAWMRQRFCSMQCSNQAKWTGQPIADRNQRIYEARAAGESNASLGRRFQLSRNRIKQICDQQAKLESLRIT